MVSLPGASEQIASKRTVPSHLPRPTNEDYQEYGIHVNQGLHVLRPWQDGNVNQGLNVPGYIEAVFHTMLGPRMTRMWLSRTSESKKGDLVRCKVHTGYIDPFGVPDDSWHTTSQ